MFLALRRPSGRTLPTYRVDHGAGGASLARQSEYLTSKAGLLTHRATHPHKAVCERAAQVSEFRRGDGRLGQMGELCALATGAVEETCH